MAQNFSPSAQPATVLMPPLMPRPVAGFRRLVQVDHPMCGAFTLLSNDASISDAGSPNYTKFAYSPGVNPNPLLFTPSIGPYQKTIHSAGTKEITWSVSGDITTASLGLVNLLFGSARGVNFNKVMISQGNASYLFDNQAGNGLPWSQFSISGNQDAALSFTLEGMTTIDGVLLPATCPPIIPRGSTVPIPIAPVVTGPPVPTWTTGNDLVLSWTLSHSTNLQPAWFNSQSMLPAYYRALDSEFTLQLTTAVALSSCTLIKIGFGGVSIAEMVVTSQNITYGDRNSPVNYQVSSTNARIQDQNAYTEFVTIQLLGVPDAGYG